MPSSRYERAARKAGYRVIAGLDEAGRGALFGPVFAGAVVLDPEKQIRGLDDSKALEPDRRGVLAERIRERAIAWAVGAADAYEIDRINIYQASRVAMSRALAKVEQKLREKSLPPCDYLLIDALKLDVAIEQKPLIQGDARSFSIAAASILAKVHRDETLCRWDRVFPEYCFANNKGYGTPEHYAALDRFGPTALHRFSFEPVRNATPMIHWSGYPLMKEVLEQTELFPCH